jgi:hypothetical protein
MLRSGVRLDTTEMSVSKTKLGYLFEPDQHYEGRKEAFNRTYGISRALCPSGDLSRNPGRRQQRRRG